VQMVFEQVAQFEAQRQQAMSQNVQPNQIPTGPPPGAPVA
jgi:hypothetical protein